MVAQISPATSPQRDFAAVFFNGFDGSKSFISDRVEEKRRQSLAVRSAPAVIASTRSRRPNKEQPATEPAAVGTAKEGGCNGLAALAPSFLDAIRNEEIWNHQIRLKK